MIIKNIDELNKLTPTIFNDFSFSFYVINEYSTLQYCVLQLLRNNDGTFQWFAIGKPFIYKDIYTSVKKSFENMFKDENTLYCVILDNKSYSNIIELLNLVNTLPYLKILNN